MPKPRAARPRPRERKSSARAFVIFFTLLHAAITLYVAMHHEPWRDEADVWLLMRDGGVGTMLARVGYVGTPPLWYLLVAPLTKLGLPYFSMTVLNLVLAWAAVCVFLVYAPFSRLVRVLFVFSYFMAFEYAVVARPYALAILVFFAALACWKHRHERPLPLAIFVALMAFTTLHVLFFAAILGAIYLVETVREKQLAQRWIALAIMAAGGVTSAVLLRPPADMGSSHVFRGWVPDNFTWTFGNAFFPDAPRILAFVLGIVVIVIAAVAIGRRIAAQVFLWSTLAFLAVLYTTVWAAGLRHAGLITVAVVGALWLADAGSDKLATIALAISFAYAAFVGIRYWHRDVVAPFSGAEEMARFITGNGLQRFPIAAHRPAECEPLLPYLGTRFYYPGILDSGSYMLWDRAFNVGQHAPYGTAVAQAQQQFQGEPWLLVVNEPMKRAEEAGFRLLYNTRTMPFEHRDERYWLYAPLDWSGPPLPEIR